MHKSRNKMKWWLVTFGMTALAGVLLLTTGCGNKPKRGSSSSRSSSSGSYSRTSPSKKQSVPADVQARRAGENARRGAEDIYYKHVPKDVQKHVDNAGKAVAKAGKAADGFLKGAGLKKK